MQICAEILMPTYNGAQHLRAQLDSLLSQSESCWHLTVSDDGSTDDTPAILQEYAAAHPDKITIHRSGRRFGNARDHFFYLFELSTADYVLFCDQDDVWHANKVEKTLNALRKAEKQYGADTPLLVFTDLTPVNTQLQPLAPSLMQYQKQYAQVIDYRALLIQNVITGCTVGVNRALRQRAACPQSQKTLMHDWWLGVVAARFGQAIFLNECTLDYRQHEHNSVGAQNVRSARHILNKLTHLKALRKTILNKKQQAQVFLDTYQDVLSREDIAFLHAFIKPRSGPFFYLRNRAFIHSFFLLSGLIILG